MQETQIQLSNPATIRGYFEQVRGLQQSGEQYPINLDEVWPLVYSEKVVAVRALKKSFFDGDDYISFDQNVKREKGATVTHTYMLTVACMEYFIARKVREVFDVYRTVFHKTADLIEQSAPVAISPVADPALMHLLSGMQQQQTLMQQQLVLMQQQISRQDQVDRLREDIRQMQVGQRSANRPLPPAPGRPIATGTLRQALNRRISEYCGCHDATHKETWVYLYKRLAEIYGIHVTRLYLHEGEEKLDALERLGHLDKLYSILMSELNYQEE